MANAIDPSLADQLSDRLRSETERYLDLAAPIFKQARKRKPRVELRFDLKGLSAGQMVKRGRSFAIRYNLAMAAQQPDRFIHETVPHEVAHVVVNVCWGRTRPHGDEWRSVMSHFGFEKASRCHEFEVEKLASRSQRRWPYRCSCTTHQLSTTRHNRVLRQQQQYLCRKCGEKLIFSE